MNRPRVSPAQRRVLERLKTRGPCRAGEVAADLELTDVAVRQHLAALETAGLVERRDEAPSGGRGRPSSIWALTSRSGGAFPDGHGELTVSLIQAIRKSVGARGLERIVQARADDQLAAYRRLVPPGRASLRRRLEALARRRTEEGYMAEVRREKGGGYLLIEHHCPICDAARACTGLCAGELSVFQRLLGRDVRVERVEHVLEEGQRCVYRVREKKPGAEG